MKMISKTRRRFPISVNLYAWVMGWVLLISAGMVSAEEKEEKKEPAPVGFLRIANTVAPGTGNVKVLIDGKDIYAAGYKFGAVTGGIGLPPGDHNVTIRREGVKEGTTKVGVAKDQTVTLIPFAEKVPATDQEPAHFAVRILRLQQKDTLDGRSASFVSVSGQPEVTVELRDPAGKWETVFVKRLAIGEAVIRYPEGYAPVKVNGNGIAPIPISDKGNYVVVIYDDAEGKIQAVNFRDFKFLSAD